MSDIVRIQVHKSLKQVLEDIRKEVASSMKKKYSLAEIEVPRTLSSRILAAKQQGQKNLNIRVRKTSINKGVLEILG